MKAVSPGSEPPITEADLHAYVDRQLNSARHAQVERYLLAHPEEQARVQDWQRQNEGLRDLLAPVLDEPLPLRLPLRPPAKAFPWRGLAASVLVATISAGSAWSLRGAMDAETMQLALAKTPAAPAADKPSLAGFAQRAAIAHVVYSPDVRRPVEIAADQEQSLVNWLTKRMGTEVRAPVLTGLGYELMGGRLLPGDKGPVAQFMYGAAGGQRLTLYVTREIVDQDETKFQFGTNGPVNVFYWVENGLGYALSAGTDKAELMRVSKEVYQQLKHK